MTGTEPAPYPSEWESDVVLADGGTVLLRPLRTADEALLEDFYARLSDETRYLRFFSPVPAEAASTLERRLPLDYRDHMILAALLHGAIVAIARYDRLPGSDGVAEVAFTVRDDQHGRGLATVMLEHLAVIARANGLHRFVASVLPANRRMIGVFRDAGFGVSQRFADGAIEVTLALEPTSHVLAAVEVRERVAEGRSIARLLAPRTIAVVGASRRPDSQGYQVVRNLIDGGFAGPVYPVNRRAEAVAGLTAYDSLRAVPDTVDLVVAAVPAVEVAAMVEDAATVGAHAVVIVSAGFAELGAAGRAAELELVKLARAHGMRIVGPNSLGVVHTHPEVRMNALVAPFAPVAGPVGILTQSGALGLPLMARLGELGLGVSSFVSVGNKADVSGNDLLQHWEDDPRTRVVVLYLETFGNPRKFARLARRVSRSKPIVAVKSARGAAGARATAVARHVGGRLAVEDSTVEALFRQAGVLRVDTLEQLFDVARVLVGQPLPAGRRVGVIANAAGTAVLTADACEAAGLEVPPVAPVTHAALAALAPEGAHVANPVDLGVTARPPDVAEALGAVLADPGIDAAIVTYLSPFEDAEGALATALEQADGGRKPVLACLLGRSGTPFALRRGDRAIPVFTFPEGAAHALARAAERAEWLARPAGAVPDVDADVERARSIVDRVLAATDGPVALEPPDTRALLDCFGIPCHASGAPSAGGMGARSDGSTPLEDGTVVAVAGIVTDELFGPIVGIALGGIAAELLGDVAVHIVPLTDRDAHELVRSLRASPLLFGYRGRPAVAVARLEEVLVRLGVLADAVPEVDAVVLDPLLVGPTDVAAGAAEVVVRRPVAVPEPGFRRLRRP